MIYKRRSVRKYRQDRIPQGDILKMIEAAKVAPSAKNRQPWKFIIYSGNDKEALLNIMERGIEREVKYPKLPESASGIEDAKNTLRIMREAPITVCVIDPDGFSPFEALEADQRFKEIETEVTEHGGIIEEGSKVVEVSHKTGKTTTYESVANYGYTAKALDRSVVNRDQIRKVLTAYKEAIYTDLYPEREKKWAYVPKTLIFAKDDNHATMIVDVVKEVFKPEFQDGLPADFVQKITYSAGDSNALIRDLRTEKSFRIAVTVTLVATGTDVRPLEVVLFMRDVMSDVLYTQMKGRGCRTIKDDKLREVTPNADTKECYYIVDAVGVTEHDHNIPGGDPGPGKMALSLKRDTAWLMERFRL